jgi:hypothetical protein
LVNIEDFRKKFHIQIPSKSPCANFQSLAKFQIPFKNLKELFFLLVQPERPNLLFFCLAQTTHVGLCSLASQPA